MNAIYPGSFDPLTMGHYDIIKRASIMCELLYVAVADNFKKTPLFTIDERVELIKDALIGFDNVVVESFDGLLVDYARKHGVFYVIRGLRAVSDFEYEFQMALANRSLNSEFETVFLIPNKEYIFLSSTIIKDIAKYGGDISSFVPKNVHMKLKEKFKM